MLRRKQRWQDPARPHQPGTRHPVQASSTAPSALRASWGGLASTFILILVLTAF